MFLLYAESTPNEIQFYIGNLGNNLSQQTNVTDNLSLSVNSHQIRFGVDYRRINSKAAFAAYESDAVFLTLSNLLANTVPEADVIARNDNVQLAFTNVSVFAQDTWKATRTFTITYRIEKSTATSALDNLERLRTVVELLPR